ncbi:MAG: hemolysin III family protein [Pyrinomonadaceae bacterium]
MNEMTVEEVANTLTHGFGLFLSVAGLILLIILAGFNADAWHIASAVIYGLSLTALYAASTLYHGATSPELKEKLRILDHCCIYLLIAGTYTPFTLVALRGSLGMGLFISVWAFALFGIIFKIFFHHRFRAASVISYLVMGWIGVIAVQPLFVKLGLVPLILVVAGGIAYSLGTIFFGWKSLRHHHAIWHLFVLAGSVLHFLAISIYVIPSVAGL